MSREADVIILGAGVAALTAARAVGLKQADVLCLESFTHVGGNHRSCDINGYTFDIGSIIFNSKLAIFQDFPTLLPLCVPFKQRIQRVAPNGQMRIYPFEMKEALGRNPVETALNAASLLAGRFGSREPRNVEDVCIRLLGRRLYEHLGLKVYIERFYGLPATSINMRFAEQRMQFVTKAAKMDRILGTLVATMKRRFAGKPDEHDPPWHGLVRPRSGFTTMYGAAQAELEARGVEFKFGVKAHAIRRSSDGFVVATDEGEFTARRVISTIPVNDTLRLIGREEKRGLVSSDLLTLYCSFQGQRGYYAPILYNFDGGGVWKRLTMHSDPYGRVNGREYFNVEIPMISADEGQGEREFSAFAHHLRACGAFDGDLKLEGVEVTHKAYPVYSIGSDGLLHDALDQIEAFGIETMGRQGRFDYLPTVEAVREQVHQEMAAAEARRPAEGSDAPDAPPTPANDADHPVIVDGASGMGKDAELTRSAAAMTPRT